MTCWTRGIGVARGDKGSIVVMGKIGGGSISDGGDGGERLNIFKPSFVGLKTFDSRVLLDASSSTCLWEMVEVEVTK